MRKTAPSVRPSILSRAVHISISHQRARSVAGARLVAIERSRARKTCAGRRLSGARVPHWLMLNIGTAPCPVPVFSIRQWLLPPRRPRALHGPVVSCSCAQGFAQRRRTGSGSLGRQHCLGSHHVCYNLEKDAGSVLHGLASPWKRRGPDTTTAREVFVALWVTG
jgi:hypothetical protein